MAGYRYKVEPFLAHARADAFSGEGAGLVSKQLEEVIEANTAEGWEFVGVTHTNIHSGPGCIPSLFGRRAVNVVYDQVVFRRPR